MEGSPRRPGPRVDPTTRPGAPPEPGTLCPSLQGAPLVPGRRGPRGERTGARGGRPARDCDGEAGGGLAGPGPPPRTLGAPPLGSSPGHAALEFVKDPTEFFVRMTRLESKAEMLVTARTYVFSVFWALVHPSSLGARTPTPVPRPPRVFCPLPLLSSDTCVQTSGVLWRRKEGSCPAPLGREPVCPVPLSIPPGLTHPPSLVPLPGKATDVQNKCGGAEGWGRNLSDSTLGRRRKQ